jgi:hypothetical protein
MRFIVHGPYEIPREGNLVTRSAAVKREFWKVVEQDEQGLARSCGCYALVIRNVVRYIGLAARQGFKAECFAPHKIALFDHALASGRGEPHLFLVAKMTPGGRLAKPSPRGHRDIELLESLLVGRALIRNPGLENIRGTKLLREMTVPGFLNSRRGEARALAARALRRAIGG